MSIVILLAVGLAAGILAGMFGIGGGVIIIPALMYIVKLKPVQAIATSLAALIPPVGLLGAYEYYRKGDINLRDAALIAAGLFAGAFFGAKITLALPSDVVRKGYAVFMLLIAVRMLLFDK
ncbi:MAG: TSUP family transporter [Bryobacteraceae bacterium]